MSNEFNDDLRTNESAFTAANLVAEAETIVMPVIEEQLQVGSRVVETGVVRIAKRVIEEQQTVEVPTIREEVTVERVAVYQYLETPPTVRYEGDTMIIPIVREVVVTEKKLLLVEEVHVTKLKTTDHETQQFTLRKEEVIVERSPPNTERPA